MLVPLAFEVFGAAGKEVHDFISALATHKVGHGNGTWTRSRAIEWWRKRISFAVQASTSIAVDACLRRARPSTGYSLYTQVSLLRTHTLSLDIPADAAMPPALAHTATL